MGLMDNPPHSADIYQPSSGTDAGGGTSLVYSLRTAGVKGILNRASSSEREMYAQQGLTVSHTFVQPGETTAQRGDKLVYGSRSLHIVGIVVNDAIGNIAQHSKLTLEEIL